MLKNLLNGMLLTKNIFFILFILISFNLYSQNTLFKNIYFEKDKSDFINNSEKEKFFYFVNSNLKNITRIKFIGYCDDRGSVPYNLKLSEKRANYLKNLFYNKTEIDSIPFIIKYHGEVALTDKQNTYLERKENRRVVVYITIKDKKKESTKKLTHINKIKKRTHQTKNKIVEKINTYSPKLEELDSLFSSSKKGDILVLKNIQFEEGKAIVTYESMEYLKYLSYFLKKNKKYHVKLLGYVHGSKKSLKRNKSAAIFVRRLSVKRAKYIYDYLISNGINENRLSYEGIGIKPVKKKSSKLDRRAEIQITNITK